MNKGKIIMIVVNFVLIAIVIAALSVGTGILYRFEQEVNTFLSPPIVDEEALSISSESGQAMSRRIMTEGAVMLKNNGALPLDYSTDKQVNVFGWRSVDWIYGSEGQNASGGVAPETDNFDENVDIYKALNKYGIKYNTELYDMYYDYVMPDHQSANLKGVHISTLVPLREPKITDSSYYTPSLLANAEGFSDTAIVVIGRMAGEGMNANTNEQKKEGPGAVDDYTRHYLEISTEEEALLKYCGETYENVIVLMNVANPFEMGFLETIPGIDACLYIGFTGTRAAQALPGLLYGDTSPSGRTVDTFAYDLRTNPANVFTGGKSYNNYGRSYADYVENIYVGYKWYETADAEGIWKDYTREIPGENGAAGTTVTGYDAVVQFPLGFGMSYNEYSWEVGDITFTDTTTAGDEEGAGATVATENAAFTDKTRITIPVTVTNNGQYPGRDVVEVYVAPPYYGHEKESAIEKASVTLAGFAKTRELAPGASETIELVIDPYDFASYDCYDRNGNDFKGWELEHGSYTFSLRTDAHTVKTVTHGGAEQEGNFVYTVAKDIEIPLDPVTGKEVGNLFTGEDAVDLAPLDAGDKNDPDYVNPDIPWFTRADFMKPSEFADKYVARDVSPNADVDPSSHHASNADTWDDATGKDAFGEEIPTKAPKWGEDNGLMLADELGNVTELGQQLGMDYDDPQWDAVLNQLKMSEVTNMISGYYGTKALPSVGKPALADLDGPAQIKGFSTAPRGTGYPTMVVVAATWNPDLAYEFGKAYGDDMKGVSVYGVWGWAIDCHRTAWFGRNHESPSEDAMLAGTMIANAVRGLSTRGRYSFIKHFALYGYNGDSIWLTEQAFREAYLRAYRKAFVDGGALGAMTTYQGIGAEHSETTSALLTGVLRREWDFKGAITTDYIGDNNYCEAILRAGGDLGMGVKLTRNYNESSSPRVQHMIREVAHHVLYMWLHADYNARVYEANPDQDDTIIKSTSINSWVWWKPFITTVDVCAGVLCLMWAALVVFSLIFGKKKAPEGPTAQPFAGGNVKGGGDKHGNAYADAYIASMFASAQTPPPANEPPPAEAPFEELSGAAADITETAAADAPEAAAEQEEAPGEAAAADAPAAGFAVVPAAAKTYAEEYEELTDECKEYVEKVKAHVLSAEGAVETATAGGVTVKVGGKPVVTIKIRRGMPVACFKLDNDAIRSARKEFGFKLEYTKIKLRDETGVNAACRLADIVCEQHAREKEEAKERRREARRARREQAKAAEADKAKENDDE